MPVMAFQVLRWDALHWSCVLSWEALHLHGTGRPSGTLRGTSFMWLVCPLVPVRDSSNLLIHFK